MTEENKSLATIDEQSNTLVSVSSSENFIEGFRDCYKLAQVLCKANIIPQNYQGRPEDTAIAIDMASRMNVSPMMVMQNLYVVKGRPSWSGQACRSFIGARFDDVKTNYVGEQGKDSWGCYITAANKDGDILKGTTVTIAMAKAEGWYGKTGSKWQTMPELMLAYRAAAFFARVYCPEVLMGCQVENEAEDIVADQTARVVTDVL